MSGEAFYPGFETLMVSVWNKGEHFLSGVNERPEVRRLRRLSCGVGRLQRRGARCGCGGGRGKGAANMLR